MREVRIGQKSRLRQELLRWSSQSETRGDAIAYCLLAIRLGRAACIGTTERKARQRPS
jgi:hypothetical protein